MTYINMGIRKKVKDNLVYLKFGAGDGPGPITFKKNQIKAKVENNAWHIAWDEHKSIFFNIAITDNITIKRSLWSQFQRFERRGR